VDVVHCLDSYHLLHRRATLDGGGSSERPRARAAQRLGWLSPLLTQQTGRPLLKTSTLKALLAERRHDDPLPQYLAARAACARAAPPGSSPLKLYTRTSTG
jgi:hypothetical protein